MKLITYLVPLAAIVALAAPLPTTEDNTLSSNRQARTFNDFIPFIKRLLSGFGFNELLGVQGHNNGYNDDRLGLNDLMVPLVVMKFFKDALSKFGPQAGFGRTMRVLKDDSTYTITELLDDVEDSWKGYVEYSNSTESQGRSGRTLLGPFDFLKTHNKFNGQIKRKFNALLNGPEADGLAIGGGIAAGIIGSVGLGLLLSNIKLIKATEKVSGRSAGLIDDWAFENEIEDRIPIISTFETALANFDSNERSSRTLKDKFEPIALKIKEFFAENKLMNKFERLYKSRATTPSAILGGIGAGLIGSVGLGLLAAGLTDKSRSGRGRALDDNSDFDVAFSGFDNLVDGFVTELSETAEKTETQTQGRQGKFLGESRTLIHKLTFAYVLKKLIQSKKNGELKMKIDKFFKGQSPLAVTGGLTAGAIGVTGLGLLIAALVKGDKSFFEPDYDAVDASYEYDPIANGASAFGAQSFHRQDFQSTTQKYVPPPTAATISESQVSQLSQALVKIANGPCGQAQLCRELSGNINQQILIANLAAAYDDQLGAYRSLLQGVLSAARRKECAKYVC